MFPIEEPAKQFCVLGKKMAYSELAAGRCQRRESTKRSFIMSSLTGKRDDMFQAADTGSLVRCTLR
jgi:hypothetical protein